MDQPLSDMQAIRQYLNKDTSRPVTMPELSEFWKAISAEEKVRFGNESRALLAV